MFIMNFIKIPGNLKKSHRIWWLVFKFSNTSITWNVFVFKLIFYTTKNIKILIKNGIYSYNFIYSWNFFWWSKIEYIHASKDTVQDQPEFKDLLIFVIIITKNKDLFIMKIYNLQNDDEEYEGMTGDDCIDLNITFCDCVELFDSFK